MHAVLAIAGKDLRLVARDRMALFWVLGFPLLYALLFGLVGVGGGGARAALRLGVVDEDGSPAARALVASLALTPSLRVEAPRDAAAAQLDVARGGLVALVVVPRGFGDGAADVVLTVDPARPAEAGVLGGLLAEQAIRARLAVDPEAERIFRGLRLPRVAQIEVAAGGARPASPYEVSFPSGILWGVLGCVATFAVSLVVERSRGTYQRLRAAPVARATVLAGKALACALACLDVIVILVAIAAVFLHVRVADPLLLVVAAGATACGFVGLMMLFAASGTSEAAVAGAAWGTFLPLAMVGGGMIPLVAMPAWMLSLSRVSPVRWAIEALEGATWRGTPASELLPPCGLLVALGVVSFVIGAWRFDRRE